ncbi:MAG: phosphotransferase [Rhizobiales bacterium]|nr:phosphotransferase [Hyphomicrobiales bacterium]MBI3674382.1 phosphotransferase [Hyphomicrobiales bacterium]
MQVSTKPIARIARRPATGLHYGLADRLAGRLLALASIAARLVAARRGRASGSLPDREIELAVGAVLERPDDPVARSWRLLGEMPSLGNVRIYFLGEAPVERPLEFGFQAPAGTRAIVKISRSTGGAGSLVSQQASLRIIPTSNTGLEFGISHILAFGRSAGKLISIERFLPGHDGRTVIGTPGLGSAALAEAARLIGRFHAGNSASAVIGENWLEDWIVRPANRLQQPVRTLMSAQSRETAIAAFTRQQCDYWRGRMVELGWYHGDYCPGNILYSTEKIRPQGDDPVSPHRPTQVAIASIIDWDRFGTDGPAGFDICQLAVTARRVQTGQQIGDIIGELLRTGRWSAEETTWFEACGQLRGPAGDWTRQPAAMRAMVALAWLRLMAANLEKSAGYIHNRLWAAANVEAVLRLYL